MNSRALCLLVTLFSSSLLSQTEEWRPVYELQVAAAYSFEHFSYPADAIFPESSSSLHSVELHPSLGYCLSDDWEPVVDFTYAFSYSSFSYPDIDESRHQHHIGYSLGVLYNINLNPLASGYVGIKVGQSWFKYGYSNRDNGTSRPWSKPDFQLPIVVIGTRIQFTSKWGFLTSVQYSHNFILATDPYSSPTSDRIALGFGFSYVF